MAGSDTSSRAKVVRELLDSLIGKDLDRMLRTMDPNIVVRVPGERPTSGEYHGHEGVLEFTKRSRALTDDEEHVQVLDILEGEQYAAAFIQLNATRGGHRLDDPTLWLLKVDNGKVSEFVLYPRDQRKTDAFWAKND